jgi:acyl-coenzyme A synthetase/AMP-(fatty) acid ligase
VLPFLLNLTQLLLYVFIFYKINKKGDDFVTKYDRSSLRTLGTVGEPINPEAWAWYHNVVGGGKCNVVDTYWQTETGGHIIVSWCIPQILVCEIFHC